jgi:hypothetical protein
MPLERSNEEPQSKKSEDFFLEDYRLKVEYFAGHLSRMWTRFNFLLTVDSALFALFATRESLDPDTRLLFILAGLALSVLWTFFGVLDFFITRTYRKHIEDAHGLLVNGRDSGPAEGHHPYVGELPPAQQISPLYMAIVLPVGFSVVWLYLFFFVVSKN